MARKIAKYLLGALVILFATIGIVYSANSVIKKATYAELTYFLDGKKVDKAITSVFIETETSKTLYLPLRQVSELLGIKVDYNAATGMVALSRALTNAVSTSTSAESAKAVDTLPTVADEAGLLEFLKSKEWKNRLKAVEDLSKMGQKGGFAAEELLVCLKTETNQLVIEAILEAISSIGEPAYSAIADSIIDEQPGEYQVTMLYLLRRYRVEDPKYYLAVLDYYFNISKGGPGIGMMRNYIALLTNEFRMNFKTDVTNQIISTFQSYLIRTEYDYEYYSYANELNNAYRSVISAAALLGKEAFSIVETLLESQNKGKINDGLRLLGSIAIYDTNQANLYIEEALFDYNTRDTALSVIHNSLRNLASPLEAAIMRMNIASSSKTAALADIKEPSPNHYERQLSQGKRIIVDLINDPYRNGVMGIDIQLLDAEGRIEKANSYYVPIEYISSSEFFVFPSMDVYLAFGKGWNGVPYFGDLAYLEKEYFRDVNGNKYLIEEAKTYILMLTQDGYYLMAIDDKGVTEIYEVNI